MEKKKYDIKKVKKVYNIVRQTVIQWLQGNGFACSCTR